MSAFTWQVIPKNLNGEAGKGDGQGEAGNAGAAGELATAVGDQSSGLLRLTRALCRSGHRLVSPTPLPAPEAIMGQRMLPGVLPAGGQASVARNLHQEPVTCECP